MAKIYIASSLAYENLRFIEGVKLTNRQIDVLACLIGRKPYKLNAKILGISPGTYTEHINRLKTILLTHRSGRRDLLEVLETSSQYHELLSHYAQLLILHAFENTLEKVFKQTQEKKQCLIFYHELISKQDNFYKRLQNHLTLAGLDCLLSTQEPTSTPVADFAIHVCPAEPDSAHQLLPLMPNIKTVTLLVQQRALSEQKANPSDHDAYYREFITLLEEIYPDLNIKHQFEDFFIKKKAYEQNLLSHGNSATDNQSNTEEANTNPAGVQAIELVDSQPKVKLTHILALLAISIGLISYYFLFSGTSLKNTTNGYTQSHGMQSVDLSFNLPTTISHFTKRDTLTKRIWKTLLNDERPQNTVVLVGLHGLGGVGKTTLAVDTINNPERPYEFRGWFSSQTKDLLHADYMALGEKLNLFDKNMPEKQMIRRVVNWIEKRSNSLLVYDNAPNMEVLQDYLPKRGHIIITSRNYKLPHALEVDVFHEEESLKLLGKLVSDDIKQSGNYIDDAKKLVHELGYFPLAISQAGAYIHENYMSLSDYLNLYDTEKTDLLSRNIMPVGDAHSSVYVTWNLSLEQISKQVLGSDAIKLLEVIGYCYPEYIPKELLIEFLYQCKSNDAKLKFNEVVRLIRQYSLIKSSHSFVSLHRLVSQWIRSSVPNQQRKETIQLAMKTINRIYPWDKKNPKEYDFMRSLTPHLESLLNKSEADGFNKDTVDTMCVLADVYQSLGYFTKSRTCLDKAALTGESIYGPNGLGTAKLLKYLGVAYRRLGYYKDSQNYLERSLSILKANPASKASDISDTMRVLGWTYFRLHKNKESEKILQSALTVEENGEHKVSSRVASILNYLGCAQAQLGMKEQSLQSLRRALNINQSIYGDDHPSTAISMRYLGTTEYCLGDKKKGLVYLQKAYDVNMQHYGPNHIWSGLTMDVLGLAHFTEQGHSDAIPMLQKSLKIYESHFKPNHLRLCSILNNLAWVNIEKKNYKKAKELLDEALRIATNNKLKSIWMIPITNNLIKVNGHLNLSKQNLRLIQAINELSVSVPHQEIAQITQSTTLAEYLSSDKPHQTYFDIIMPY